MRVIMYRFLVAITALALSVTAQQTCYYPDGSSDTALRPCNASAAVSACCRTPTDVCLTNGLCFSTGLNVVIRRGCTDSTWNSTLCPKYCETGWSPLCRHWDASENYRNTFRPNRSDPLRQYLHLLLRPKRSGARLLQYGECDNYGQSR